MRLIKPSEFDVGLLQFDAPDPNKRNGGGAIALKYDDEYGLELKIPAGRVAFDCGPSSFGEGSKLEMAIELSRTPEFRGVRGLLAAVDNSIREHLRDNADEISKVLTLDAGTIDTLRTGNNMKALLRPANDPKFPDRIGMKWTEKDKINILDTEKNSVKCSSIGKGSTVEAFVNIKGIWVAKGCVTVQTEAIGLKVTDCVKPDPKKKRKVMSQDEMFD